MEQTEMLYLDFNGKRPDEILGIDKVRADEIMRMLAAATKDICANYKEYIFDGEGENENAVAIHKGKILQRLLAGITDYQERTLVLMASETGFKLVHRHVEKMITVNAIKD